MPHDVLQQQFDYHRARAGEYDEWFLRQGRYDRGPERDRDEPASFRTRLDGLGWSADIRSTPRFFVYGSGTPSA